MKPQMDLPYWTNEDDLPEVIARARLITETEARLDAERALIRCLEEQVDAIRVEHRPTYPTQVQLDAIEALASTEITDTHHGQPIEPAGYSFKAAIWGSNEIWVYPRTMAPYSRKDGHLLWQFTDDEVEAYRTALAVAGWTVLKDWHHSEGVSIVVRRSL